MMVSGVPSMHICLDFIPELLSQPHADKQVRACVRARAFVGIYVRVQACVCAREVCTRRKWLELSMLGIRGELVGVLSDVVVVVLPACVGSAAISRRHLQARCFWLFCSYVCFYFVWKI